VRSNRRTVWGTVTWAVGRTPEVDAALVIAAAQRGDAAAIAELFESHRQQVARQVLRMTGDASSVDDLVQEVFIAAFSAITGFRRDAQFDTWLYTIAANKVRNWWDARRRRHVREQNAIGAAPNEARTPEDEALATEHLQRFYAALGGLPDKLREAFTARAIEHLSLQEASRVLDIPISTVSYRTRRAEELLCAALGLPPPPNRGDGA
jgi:RNA polymerase sigma-70 factor (ECF subfamily)